MNAVARCSFLRELNGEVARTKLAFMCKASRHLLVFHLREATGSDRSSAVIDIAVEGKLWDATPSIERGLRRERGLPFA